MRRFDVLNPLDPLSINTPDGRYNRRYADLARLGVELTAKGKDGTLIPKPNFNADSDTAILRWEQMICQLSRNAALLFEDAGADVVFSPNCNQNADGHWDIPFRNAADILVIGNTVDAETDETDDSDVDTDFHLGSYKTLKFVTDDKMEGEVDINNTGVLGNGEMAFRAAAAHCYFVKIDTDIDETLHYTGALVYPRSKFVLYFDTEGSDVPVSWDKLGRPTSGYRRTRRRKNKKSAKRKNKRRRRRCFNSAALEHRFVCGALEVVLPGYSVVNLIERSLQRAEQDVHCQTWVYLIPYLLLIPNTIPNVSGFANPYQVHKFLSKLTIAQSLRLIRGWWQYLLYYIPVQFTHDYEEEENNNKDPRIFKTLQINCEGAEPVLEKFLIDTGASQTAIAGHVAKRLACQAGPHSHIRNATSTQTRPTLHVRLSNPGMSDATVDTLANVRDSHMIKHSLLGMDWINKSGWLTNQRSNSNPVL